MYKDNCRTTTTCNSKGNNNNSNIEQSTYCLVLKMSYFLYNSYTWTLHLKIWTHFGFGSQCALHLKSWTSCSLHLNWGGGVYLIWGYTSSEKLGELFTSSEKGGISDLRVCKLHKYIYRSAMFGVVVFKASMFNWGESICHGYMCIVVYIYIYIYIYRSAMRCAKFGIVVFKASILDGWGVNLLWVYVHCSVYIWQFHWGSQVH